MNYNSDYINQLFNTIDCANISDVVLPNPGLPEKFKTIKVTIPSSFQHQRVKLEWGDQVYSTNKNIPIFDSIIYFFENCVIVCGCKQKVIDEIITAEVWMVLDIDNNQIMVSSNHNQKAEFNIDRYCRTLKTFIQTHQDVVVDYLKNTESSVPFFYYRMIYHFGHTIIDTLVGIDVVLKICKSKAIVCLPTPLFSRSELDYIFDHPNFIDLDPTNHVDSLALEVIKENSLLLNPSFKTPFTFNFIKRLEVPISNKKETPKVILVAKYDFRCPINQFEFFRQIILNFNKHTKATFVIVSFFKLFYTSTQIKETENPFESEHKELMNDLTGFFGNSIEIIDTDGFGIGKLRETLCNSFCYFSPYGSMQHVVGLFSNSKYAVCHGNKKIQTKDYDIIEIPTEYTKRELPLSDEAAALTKRYHEKTYMFDIEAMEPFLDQTISSMFN